jgi:tetratricopeptide (TPR) repeat protein
MNKKFFLTLFTSAIIASSTFGQTLADAIRLSENEAYESSEKAFNTLISADATNADIYYYQGQNLLKLEKQAEAKAAFEKGLSINSNSALNNVGLGKLAYENGDINKATEYFTKAKTLINDKSVKKAERTKVLCEIAETYIYSTKKDLAAAELILVDAERLDPTNTDVFLLKGDLVLEKDPTNASGALAEYNKALVLNPKLTKAIIRKGKIYKRAGSPNEALTLYKEAEAIDATFVPAYREKAELYFLAGKKDQAIQNYEKYLELNNSTLAQQRYDYFLYDNKQYNEAIVQLNKIKSSGSTWKYADRLLGYSQMETGDFTNGLSNLNNFMSNKGDIKTIALDYKYMGMGYSKTGNDSIGVTYLNEAMKLDTNNVDIQTDIANSLYKQKKYTDAIQAYLKKIAMGKDLSATEYNNLGNSYKNLKDFQNADGAYAKVAEKSPSFANAYLNRAVVNASMDPGNTQYLAKPHFEAYLSKVDFADAKNANNIKMALEYLGSEAWKNTKDIVKAKEYYTKLKELDAENAAQKAFFASPDGK